MSCSCSRATYKPEQAIDTAQLLQLERQGAWLQKVPVPAVRAMLLYPRYIQTWASHWHCTVTATGTSGSLTAEGSCSCRQSDAPVPVLHTNLSKPLTLHSYCNWNISEPDWHYTVTATGTSASLTAEGSCSRRQRDAIWAGVSNFSSVKSVESSSINMPMMEHWIFPNIFLSRYKPNYSYHCSTVQYIFFVDCTNLIEQVIC
jgi:hypothetical protein